MARAANIKMAMSAKATQTATMPSSPRRRRLCCGDELIITLAPSLDDHPGGGGEAVRRSDERLPDDGRRRVRVVDRDLQRVQPFDDAAARARLDGGGGL